jgi:hypothetical protein
MQQEACQQSLAPAVDRADRRLNGDGAGCGRRRTALGQPMGEALEQAEPRCWAAMNRIEIIRVPPRLIMTGVVNPDLGRKAERRATPTAV